MTFITDPNTTVAQLVAARAGDDHPALLFEDESWTWDEHTRIAAERAAWLTSLRVEGPFHIGVLLDNVPEFSFLLAGAALCGAVVVGLNPTRKGAELARDLVAGDCQLVVTEHRHLAALDGLELPFGEDRVFNIDTPAFHEAVSAFAGAPLPAGLSSITQDDLHMLIFTSGTSGEPKAVRVTHRKVAHPGVVGVSRGLMTRDDRAYLTMPMFHSACIMAGWAPCLTAGATMVLRRKFSASGFLPDVRRYGITMFHYVGKPLAYVLATPEQPDDADNPMVKAVGNEAAELDIGRFAARFGCFVSDGFGSTEGGVYLSRTPESPPGSLGWIGSGVEILDPATGEPVPAAQFDADGRLLNPDEAIGELVNTAGRGAFEGYYGESGRVAEEERMRGGMYWSGDLAYRNEDGAVFFAGRTIEWLRVDGENFAAAPVERVLARFAPFSQVAVYAVPAADTGDQVMAAVTLREGEAFDPDAFTAFLAEQPDLGSKWAPRFLRVAIELPSTETNKVLKRVLAREQWRCEDPVWWRPGRERAYCLLDPDARAEILKAFSENGRERLLA